MQAEAISTTPLNARPDPVLDAVSAALLGVMMSGSCCMEEFALYLGPNEHLTSAGIR